MTEDQKQEEIERLSDMKLKDSVKGKALLAKESIQAIDLAHPDTQKFFAQNIHLVVKIQAWMKGRITRKNTDMQRIRNL